MFCTETLRPRRFWITNMLLLCTPHPQDESAGMVDMNHAPLAGFGYGLPVSRLYARYLGGELNLISTQVGGWAGSCPLSLQRGTVARFIYFLLPLCSTPSRATAPTPLFTFAPLRRTPWKWCRPTLSANSSA